MLRGALVQKTKVGLSDSSVSFGPSVIRMFSRLCLHSVARVSLNAPLSLSFRRSSLDKPAKRAATPEELATIRKQVKTQVVYSGDGVPIWDLRWDRF